MWGNAVEDVGGFQPTGGVAVDSLQTFSMY